MREREYRTNFENQHKAERFVYPREQLENTKRLRYQLFLRVGNMSDILALTPWDFYGIVQEAGEENERISGKTSTKPLSESQMDMIKKAKGEI